MFRLSLPASIAAIIFSLIPVTSLRADLYDVVDLAKSGVSGDVMLAYAQKSNDTYDLSAGDIKYLYDMGVPDDVVQEMLNHPADVSEVALAGTERDYSTV